MPELGIWVEFTEELFVVVFESEVESLSGEVSEYVDEVTSPEGGHAFFSSDTLEAVDDSSVFLLGGEIGHRGLGLEEEFDTFDGSGGCFGDSSGDTTEEEVCDESFDVFALGHVLYKDGWLFVAREILFN